MQELFEFVQPEKYPALLVSGLLKSIAVAISTKVNRAARYHDIWPLGVLLRHIQNGPPAERLQWKDLMARTAALFMIFIPCRQIAMIRMDVARQVWKKVGQVLVVPAKEKMDKGRGYTELVIRRSEVEALCPLRHFHLLEEGAARRRAPGCLFCSEDGKPYTQSAQLSRLLKQLLTQAGIDPQYPAYSIRHALITALFDAGLKEEQVNAYTGHSNNAHTAATSYFHLDRKWVGHAIAAGSLPSAARECAVQVIERDNAELQAEEMDEYGESELDVLQAPAAAPFSAAAPASFPARRFLFRLRSSSASPSSSSSSSSSSSLFSPSSSSSSSSSSSLSPSGGQ